MTITKLERVPSGIPGFDDISHGGIPKGRTTLLCGSSGSGKTVFSLQFIYKGITDHNENGVFVTFEERPVDIIKNTIGFGWDIESHVDNNRIAFVDASPDNSTNIVIGDFDLAAFMARIEYAINRVNAKRVAIDSVSSLFSHYQSVGVIRRELYRIASRLKERDITCILTAERPLEEGQIFRFGIEEFVSDNVLLLHNRLTKRGDRDRTIEILKLRGLSHETDESPLIVSNTGMSIYPRPRPELRGKGFSEKISTGIKGLDDILHGGIYKNSSTLISGASGTGKTVTSLHFIMEGAMKGEHSLLIEFEESPDQLFRNAASFGWDLKQLSESGLLTIVCHYPEDLKPEQYLKTIQDLVISTGAKRVALDSLSALERIYPSEKFREFVVGLNSFLKMHEATSFLTNTSSQLLGMTEITETHLSTATDNIIILKYVELNGKMMRLLTVLKQRGGMHRKELMRFEVTPVGMEIYGTYHGVENLLSGSARITTPPVDITKQMVKIDEIRKQFLDKKISKDEYETRMQQIRDEIEEIQKQGF